MRQVRKEYYLSGKEYFSEGEAAHYCCVGKTKFREDVMPLVPPRTLFGKKIYRRNELQELLDRAPAWKAVQQ